MAGERIVTDRIMDQAQGRDWVLYNGDSAEVLPGLPDHSVDLSVFSPPFSSTYTYSPSDRDLGNVASDRVFWEQFGFISRELLRLMRPGRPVFEKHYPGQFPLIDFALNTVCAGCTQDAHATTADQMVRWPCAAVMAALGRKAA
jgi:hypothetical protein